LIQGKNEVDVDVTGNMRMSQASYTGSNSEPYYTLQHIHPHADCALLALLACVHPRFPIPLECNHNLHTAPCTVLTSASKQEEQERE